MGLTHRIGLPRDDIAKAMREEHTILPGYDAEFAMMNGRKTCPSMEFGFVLDPATCPPEGLSNKRKLRRPEDLMAIRLVRSANLTVDEVRAVVLYTGPLFAVSASPLSIPPPLVVVRASLDGQSIYLSQHTLVYREGRGRESWSSSASGRSQFQAKFISRPLF
mmetsp:Transcript_74492/g.199119  ORF Transcript_74492/g.199119 Transcript_74492/m.199119 type:complete len:163 (-) Transcript_74492:724-1212(-)